MDLEVLLSEIFKRGSPLPLLALLLRVATSRYLDETLEGADTSLCEGHEGILPEPHARATAVGAVSNEERASLLRGHPDTEAGSLGVEEILLLERRLEALELAISESCSWHQVVLSGCSPESV